MASYNMKSRTSILLVVAALLTLGIWTWFTWPLATVATKAIPIAHSGGGSDPVRYMQAGDHLQLHYYFWLFSDMLTGGTPWMYNPYEFHVGVEEERYEPHAYYAPFSWVYSLMRPVTDRALGYNIAGLISLWLTYIFTFLLVRRYVKSGVIAGLAALLGILLPYRWFALMGGSPTGFGMTFTPILLWGLDRAIHDRSWRGGFWAGLAIVFSYTSDLHMFFFNVLLTPAWCALSAIACPGFPWRTWRPYQQRAVALLPVALLFAAVFLHSQVVATELTETHMAEGRAISEVMTHSPAREGFLGWPPHHVSAQIYVGYTLLALFLIGAVTLLIGMRRSSDPVDWRRLLFAGGLVMGLLVTALLSLGPHGPRGANFYMRIREWVPNYDMIRQTGKIFGIMPTLFAVLAGLSLQAIHDTLRKTWALVLVGAVWLAGLGFEYARHIDPPICILATEQGAYEAALLDAQARDVQPHIMVVPLWPGDTHYAAVYQHYASLYRLRMLNGYTPAINRTYFETIFLRFQSINQGSISDDQADELLERGVQHIILHEDMFPEKVSPFPVVQTLDAFLAHPRLEWLAQDGPVWAFRILPEADPDAIKPRIASLYLPARYFSINRGIRERPIEEEGDGWFTPITGGPPVADMQWMIRARGEGAIDAAMKDADSEDLLDRWRIETSGDDVKWIPLHFELDQFRHIQLTWDLSSPTVEVDHVQLIAGNWSSLEPGESWTLPAAAFFRAGHMDRHTGSVQFLAERDGRRLIMYGPRMPLPPGSYEFELQTETDAPAGTSLGEIQILVAEQDTGERINWQADPSMRIRHAQTEYLPVSLVWVFGGAHDVRMDRVIIHRLRDE